MIETGNENDMPVRKFYNNTFGSLLNRAKFALIKKQMKEPDNMELFTCEGMVKFIAFQLLDSPPEGEIEENREIPDDSL